MTIMDGWTDGWMDDNGMKLAEAKTSSAFYSARGVLEPSVDGGPCRITKHANMYETEWNAQSHTRKSFSGGES